MIMMNLILMLNLGGLIREKALTVLLRILMKILMTVNIMRRSLLLGRTIYPDG
jgi:hypothetical protein